MIYAVCYAYLDPESKKALSPDVILNLEGYDLDELSASILIHEIGSRIGLPYEITNSNFPYLEYFESSDPKPLSIMVCADIFIHIMESYQLAWKKFQEKPQQEQEIYYTQIYEVIEKYLPLNKRVFTPNILINVSEHAVRGYKAKRMVMRSADIFGLSRQSVYYAFDCYFRFPIDLYSIFYSVIVTYVCFLFLFLILQEYSLFVDILLILVVGTIYSRRKEKILEPLTAKKFASKIIGVWLMNTYSFNKKE